MSTRLAKYLLVSIPHAGVLCPAEIPLATLSENQPQLAADNIDWYTDRLYDFRDILGNAQVCFPYSQVYVNVNRHPRTLEESVPIVLNDLPIYQEGQAPSFTQRQALLKKYHAVYHRAIANRKKNFILDGHSTVTGHTDAAGNSVTDDIILGDRQASPLDPPGGILTAPEGYLETYAEELERRLAGLHIQVARNTTYVATYGHVMAAHGWDGETTRGRRAPLLLQETNEDLYIKNGRPDWLMIEELRRIFAESLASALACLERTLE